MAARSGDVRVLCVDDDEAFCELVSEILERVDDHIVAETVTDPTETIDTLRADDRFECVVSDYDMPEMDGLDLYDEVRETFPSLPFILHTGKGSEAIASEAISRGVTDYIQKDSGMEHYELLANRIHEYVDGYRADREHALTEQRYRRLVEQSVVGIALSQEGVFQYANPKFAEIFGYTVDEIAGMPVLSVIDESDHERVEQALMARETGDAESVHYVVTAKDKDGNRFDIEVNGSQVTYDGEPAVLGVVQPLDVRRKALATMERNVMMELNVMLESALGAIDDVDAGGERLDAVHDTIEEALAAIKSSVVDSEPRGRSDLETRCREVFDRVAPDDATLVVRKSVAVPVGENTLEYLFTALWRIWSDVDRPLAMTVTAGDDGFEVAIEPEDATEAVESPPDPPAIGRIAELLGWDVYMSETPAGGVVYSFRGVDPVE